MTTTLSPPIRILAVVGVLAAVALGIVLVTHSRSSSNDSSATATPPATTPSTPVATPATPEPATPAKPKVVLLPGLPTQVAHALRHSKVVVVAVWSNGAKGDRKALGQARAGAKAVHAGFVAVNVASEKTAKGLGEFAGTTTAPPAVLVVKRPGKVVNRFDGFADSQLVAQAAHDAGAGR